MKTRQFNNWYRLIQNSRTRAEAESAGYYFLDMTEKQAEKLWKFYVDKGNSIDEHNRVMTDNGLKFCPKSYYK